MHLTTLKTPNSPNSGLTLQKVKTHLGLFDDDSVDDYISDLIITAEGIASDYLGWSIGERKMLVSAPDFRTLEIPTNSNSTFSDIEITYLNNSGTKVVLAESDYSLDATTPDIMKIKFNNSVNSLEVSRNFTNPLGVTFKTKMKTELRSDKIKHALMVYCFEMYNNQGNTAHRGTKDASLTSERLLFALKDYML